MGAGGVAVVDECAERAAGAAAEADQPLGVGGELGEGDVG